MRPLCTVEGCSNPHAAKGMCRKHYYRVRQNGDLQLRYRPDGQGTVTRPGYIVLNLNGRKVFEHVYVAELALGRRLPRGVLVHHHNESKADNRNENLVICPDQTYHKLLHKRMRALAACGNADWRPCAFCKQYDRLENLRPQGRKDSGSYCHSKCRSRWEMQRHVKFREPPEQRWLAR